MYACSVNAGCVAQFTLLGQECTLHVLFVAVIDDRVGQICSNCTVARTIVISTLCIPLMIACKNQDIYESVLSYLCI